MNIVYTVSQSWMKHIPIQIYSIARYNHGQIDVYIISKDFVDEDREILASINLPLITIHLIEFQESFPNVNERFTEYTLFRLFIPRLIPKLDKCLYLDADTIVVGNLSELYNTEVPLIAGVIDAGMTPKRRKRLNYPEHHNYINAGVMLMNLKAIRSSNINLLWESMINSGFPLYDQDIINYTHENNVTIIGSEYNSSVITEISENPKIVHYVGDKKTNWVHSFQQAEYWEEATRYYLKNKT